MVQWRRREFSRLKAALMSDVTRILQSIEEGDPEAAEALLPLVYDELRRLAAAKLAREGAGQTLQATALVHEAYVRLVDVEQQQQWNSRGHFFAAAGEAMRRILVERARQKLRLKHGGERRQVDIPDLDILADDRAQDVLRVDAALNALAEQDPQTADLVKLRYFVGLSLGDAAAALGIPRRTADRIWAYAKAWLQAELSE
jgi:RNA polymerase sigma factor (TIGR02999 family)